MEFWLFVGLMALFYAAFKSNSSGAKAKQQSHTPTPKTQSTVKNIRRSSSRQPHQVSASSNVRSVSEGTEELVTFTISHGFEEGERSRNQVPAQWIKPGDIRTISGRCIEKGFFYTGGKLKGGRVLGTEASLVDDGLKIAAKRQLTPPYEDESLGYWPRFNALSPKCRGYYLDWLASDRDCPQTPIGYVFIYFYGLERRVCSSVKGKNNGLVDAEFLAIFAEVARLMDVYSESRSFSGYASRLLEFMRILRPELTFPPVAALQKVRESLLFQYQLAIAVDKELPISADLALAWLKFYPDYYPKTPARRCEPEFTALFKKKYQEKFNSGMAVKPNKKRLVVQYYPASGTLDSVNLDKWDLPDPSLLKSPTNKLIAIADTCTDLLDPYSRYLGKKGTSRSDINAILLLPDALSDTQNASLEAFTDWANTRISQHQGLAPLADFWEFTGMPLPAKINKKESELIANLAQKAGFGIAPDPRYHHAKPSVEGSIVLFAEGHGTCFEPSRAFNEIGMALRLGAMVATTDQQLDTTEVTLLHQLIDHDTTLSPTEKRSLHGYLLWRLNSPANMNGLKARLQNLGNREKQAVSHILVGVALADGRVDPTEIKALEKLYTALGLDKALVASDVHNLSASRRLPSSALGSSAKATPAKTPTGTPTQLKGTTAGFQLDKEILALHESETSDVQAMLGAIFVEEEAEAQVPHTSTDAPVTTELEEDLEGLDAAHGSLYRALVAKEQWSRAEVETLCSDLGLMIDGAIEAINDWSFDRADAAVFDADDNIYVDLEIVEELEG